MRSPLSAFLLVALAALLSLAAVPTVRGQDPTAYLTAYDPITVTNCGDSPYTIIAQAWEISQCVYTVKYTVQGQPGLSDFGFQLGTDTRSITVTGCTTTWVSSSGSGNSCYPTYSVWQATGGLIKMDSDLGCNQNSTFWITSSAATLVQGGSVAWKGGPNCWTCDNVPYVLANHPNPASCLALSPSPSPLADPLPSASPVVVVAPSPSPSASPAAFASPSMTPSLSDPSPLPSESPSTVTEPSASPSPSLIQVIESSPSPSPVVFNEPSPSPSPSPAVLDAPSPSPSPSASSSPTSSPAPGGGDSTNAGAIAGGVAGGLAGLAGLAALGGAAAGGGYLLYRWINRTDTLAAPASALDSNAATAVGDNALFQESNVMQPNALFADGV